MVRRTVICLSGGIDSTVLLYDLRAQGHECVGLGVDYGQRHRRELEAAAAICDDLEVPYVVAKVDAPFLGSELTDGRSGVVVPNRNMTLLSLAGAVAVSHQADNVAIACHAGDGRLFPDCRPAFLEEAFRALKKGSGLSLLYPYVTRSKAQIVELGVSLGVPFDRTWSCYRGGERPCGQCLACEERHNALHPFSLERTENPHPKMLLGAIEARQAGGPYWEGYLRAMADATGEDDGDLIAWMERVG